MSSFADWFAQDPERLAQLFSGAAGSFSQDTSGAAAPAATPPAAAPAPAPAPATTPPTTTPRTVSMFGRDTGLSPTELRDSFSGLGQALRPAQAGGATGSPMPPGGSVFSAGNPAAMMQLLQQRQLMRQQLMQRVPGLLGSRG